MSSATQSHFSPEPDAESIESTPSPSDSASQTPNPDPSPSPSVAAAAPSSHAPQKQQPQFTSRGGSAIVSPFGTVLAGPQWEDEAGIIYADVDFDDCVRGRLDLDTAGSYSRNDSFRLDVRGLELEPLPY